MKSCSLSGPALAKHKSVMILGNLFTNGQSYSCACVSCPRMEPLENLKNLFVVLRLKPDTVVREMNVMIAFLRNYVGMRYRNAVLDIGPYLNYRLDAGFCKLECVCKNIDGQLLQLEWDYFRRGHFSYQHNGTRF